MVHLCLHPVVGIKLSGFGSIHQELLLPLPLGFVRSVSSPSSFSFLRVCAWSLVPL